MSKNCQQFEKRVSYIERKLGNDSNPLVYEQSVYGLLLIWHAQINACFFFNFQAKFRLYQLLPVVIRSLFPAPLLGCRRFPNLSSEQNVTSSMSGLATGSNITVFLIVLVASSFHSEHSNTSYSGWTVCYTKSLRRLQNSEELFMFGEKFLTPATI
jgi:hypothetical protein